MTTDRRRARGEVSRRAIMSIAMDMASTEGLEALSIGRLAASAGMSKGGIVALFGTKEQLQLATVTAAASVFRQNVVVPALAAPSGLSRLRAMTNAWLSYSEHRVFAGGCFFAATTVEFGSRDGHIREAIVTSVREWQGFLTTTVQQAVERGELAPETEPSQLAFEITSVLHGANSESLLFGHAEPYFRARAALDRLLTQPA